ncbi:MAG TPA: ATP-binding protein [Rariglobus sp.]|nr:ATP-binding protein [Rariglobus sp.]
MWVTGYAVVGAAVAGGAHPMDILGLDISADGWRRNLWEQAFHTALYIWTVLGLPFGVLVMSRYWGMRGDTIRMLSKAVEQSRSALMITNLKGRIEYVNHGLCQQIGYEKEELTGRDWNEFRTKASSPEVLADMIATVRAGHTWTGEWFNRRKTGELYPVYGMVSPVHDRHGRLSCFITTLQDMSGPKKAEAELRAAKEKAESGERAKGEFLAAMGHELRTPLNGIVGFASLLQSTPLSPEQGEYVHTIHTSSEALLKITGDILDYSRLEAGRLPLETSPCALEGLIEDVLDLVAGQADAKGVVLLHRVEPDVPALVELDPGRLRQVLVNLLGNAIKFTAAGEVEVAVEMRPAADSPGADVVIEFMVRDTGSGISEADQARLFRPFSQVDGSRHRRHGGVGLGLAISRTLVQLMGGDISLESEPGKGTVFRFFVDAKVVDTASVSVPGLEGRRIALIAAHAGLEGELLSVIDRAGGIPVVCDLANLENAKAGTVIVDCDEALVARIASGAIGIGSWCGARAFGLVTSACGAEERKMLRPLFHTLMTKPLHHKFLLSAIREDASLQPPEKWQQKLGLNLLLVDDNAVNLRLLQSIVHMLGCDGTPVSGGEECLDAIARGGDYDAVLLDLHMPDVDGMEVARRLRAGELGEKMRKIWITIVTADSRATTSDEVLRQGCDDFIAKPVTVESCLAALQRIAPSQSKV